MNTALLCLGNISKYFSCDNLKNTGLYRFVYYFLVHYVSIVVTDISNFHKNLKKGFRISQWLNINKL